MIDFSILIELLIGIIQFENLSSANKFVLENSVINKLATIILVKIRFLDIIE